MHSHNIAKPSESVRIYDPYKDPKLKPKKANELLTHPNITVNFFMCNNRHAVVSPSPSSRSKSPHAK